MATPKEFSEPNFISVEQIAEACLYGKKLGWDKDNFYEYCNSLGSQPIEHRLAQITEYQENVKDFSVDDIQAHVKGVIDALNSGTPSEFQRTALDLLNDGAVEVNSRLKKILYGAIWNFNPTNNISCWQGRVGFKIPIQAEIVSMKTINTKFGPSMYYKLKDAAGNILVKFGKIPVTILKADHAVGDTFHCIAMIKDHQEFRGENQTVLGTLSKN
jgi:hypothetical protein